MSLYSTLITAGILVVLATVIKYLGGENLIAGYNTSSPAQKKYMKDQGIGAFVGNYIYLLALVILGGYLVRRAGFIWGQDVAWGVFIAVIIVMLVRVQRFNPPSELSETKSGKTQKITIVISTVLTLVILSAVAWSALPSHYSFSGDAMTISGAYGTTVSYSNIDSIRLEPDIPSIGYKTNGLDMGPILKGHFMVDKFDKCLLSLRSSQGPVIIITFKDRGEPLLINMPEPDQTRHLYQQIKTRVE